MLATAGNRFLWAPQGMHLSRTRGTGSAEWKQSRLCPLSCGTLYERALRNREPPAGSPRRHEHAECIKSAAPELTGTKQLHCVEGKRKHAVWQVAETDTLD